MYVHGGPRWPGQGAQFARDARFINRGLKLAAGGGAVNYAKNMYYASTRPSKAQIRKGRAGLRTSYKSQVTKRTYTNSKKKLPSRRGVKRDVAQLKNAVKDLRLSENASLGKLTYRQISVERLLVGVNAQASNQFAPMGINIIETAGAQLQYYDPSNPATLVTAPLGTGTYSRKVLIKSATATVNLKNNYQSDVHATVYLCKVRDDTSQSPQVCFENVIDDAQSGTETTIGMYPTDSSLMNQLWHLKRMHDGIIAPGKAVRVSHTEGPFEYDPATTDSHALQYQREYKSFAYLIVIRGTLGHDQSNDQQGRLQAGIDLEINRTLKLEYDAGVNLSRVYVSTTYDTPTVGFVQSNQPIPDNVGYSVA